MKTYTDRQLAIMDAITVMVVCVVTSGDKTEQALRDASDYLLESAKLTHEDLIGYKANNQNEGA